MGGGIYNSFISLVGLISMICLLVAVMMLLQLIQQAFNKAGVLWGVISTLYPPGTYLYCRKNWDVMRDKFVIISGLLIVSIVLLVVVKIA